MRYAKTPFLFYHVILLFLITVSAVNAGSKLDSLRQLVNNSEGDVKLEYSYKLANQLIEYSKLREGISLANEILTKSKAEGKLKYELRAFAIMSRGYLLAGDMQSAAAYGDSTMNLARANNSQYGLGLAYQASGTPKLYMGDVQGAISTLDSSLAIFTVEDYPLENAVSKLLIASVLATSGRPEESFTYLYDAKKIFEENNDEYKSGTIELNIALLKGTLLGQYEEAIHTTLGVLPYFESVDDSLKMATGYGTVGNCYDAIGNYDKAIEYFEYALSMVGSTGNVLMNANFINNLGEVYKHKEDYDNANKYYKQALDIFIKYGITEGVIVAENNIGECLLVIGEYDNALGYFVKSLEKVDKENDYYKTAILYKNMGKVYLAKNDIPRAINYFKMSIKSSTTLNLIEELFPAYKDLSDAYSRSGNYREAYKYHLLYTDTKDEFTRTSNAEKISEIDTRYQTVKKEQEIELLTKNQEIQELQIFQQRVIGIGLTVAIVIIGIFGIVNYKRLKDNKKLNAELNETNAQIERQKDELKNINEQLTYTNQKLSASEADLKQLNATKDKFFSVIAHDLKGPFSSLLGLTEIMAEDTEEMTAEELKRMSSGIYNASQQVYALTENLLEWSRAQLDMLNIKRELFDFNELVNENARLFKNSLVEKKITLNQELCDVKMVNTDKDMVDFALRNLLNNAIKFTNEDGQISISSKVEKDFLKVEVADTGVGIAESDIDKLFKIESTFTTSGTKQEKGTGLGLILVREFVEKIGGAIFVKSKVNHGTTFTFTIPLSAQA